MRAPRWILACYCLAALTDGPLVAGTEADRILIARIRYHMKENLERLPNYTCTQTIERSLRPARTKRFQLLDTMRLEVALVDGKELFAWPGSGKFEDRELRDIVGGGTSGNGNFGLHARAVFLGNYTTFEYLGEVEKEEGRVFSYAYHVPLPWSGYMIRSGELQGVAGYHGFFDADPETLDVLSFDVIADDEIPPKLQLLQAVTRMRYERMKIGEGEFLLPVSSEISLTDYSGTENRNLVHLSGCKQYGTESTISFDDPPPSESLLPPALAPPSATAAGRAPEVGELPSGLFFEVDLSTGFKFPGTAIGDLVEGRVAGDVKKNRAVMIPKGSIVRGRVLRVGTVPSARMPSAAVVIRLHEIELPGGRAEIRGIPERVSPVGAAGIRLSVDNGVIYIVSGIRRELARGMRIWFRLEPQSEKR